MADDNTPESTGEESVPPPDDAVDVDGAPPEPTPESDLTSESPPGPRPGRTGAQALLVAAVISALFGGGTMYTLFDYAARRVDDKAAGLEQTIQTLAQQLTGIQQQLDDARAEAERRRNATIDELAALGDQLAETVKRVRSAIDDRETQFTDAAKQALATLEEEGVGAANLARDVRAAADMHLYDLNDRKKQLEQQTAEIQARFEKITAAIHTMEQESPSWQRIAAELLQVPGFVDTVVGATQPQLPPLGTILPYVGDPAEVLATGNWMLCDGSAVPEDSPLLALGIAQAPDLAGRVVRGRKSDEPIAATGGADETEVLTTAKAGQHAHEVDSHRHTLPPNTGWISPQNVVVEGEDLLGYTRSREARRNAGGAHRHDLGGETGSDSPDTDETGEHTHSLGPIETVPSYVSVHWIIRIR